MVRQEDPLVAQELERGVAQVVGVPVRDPQEAASANGLELLFGDRVLVDPASEIGRPDDNLIDTVTNLNYGCRILQFYLRREDGDLASALAGYNGSSGSRRYSDKVHQVWLQHWKTEPLSWQ